MNAITKAKNDELKTSVDRREIKLDHAESLLKDIASREINGSKFKKEYNNIADDLDAVLQKPMLKRSQVKMVENVLLLKEIPVSG